MLKLLCTALGIGVFVAFMILVGNPHYIETIIGLVLAVCVGFGSYFIFSKRKN